MNVYDITLTCDHKLLVVAFDAGDAREIASGLAAEHKTEVKAVDLLILEPGLLAWYAGPWSMDAITDPHEDDEITREGRAMAAGGLI